MQKETYNSAEPLEYVRGFTKFLGCKIDLSKKPLIPRPETEYWVGEVIKQISLIPFIDGRQKKGIRVLDIFCGSGCIGLAILQHVKNVEVTFADKYKYFSHPKFVKSDIFEKVVGRYDYIFANPPYIPDYRKNPSTRLRAILRNRIQKSVLDFEPNEALFGGEDGLFYIRKFLKGAKNHLNPGGTIFMEFSPEQKSEVAKLAKKYNFKTCEFFKDQYSRYRWVEIV